MPSHSTQFVKKHLNIYNYESQLGALYQLKEYEGSVTLFQAADNIAEVVDDDMNKAAHGWDEYCPNLNEVSVEGDHYSILLGDAAYFIACHINGEMSLRFHQNDMVNNMIKTDDSVEA